MYTENIVQNRFWHGSEVHMLLLCEHESSACPQSKEAHMEKIILKFGSKLLM